MLSCNYRQLFKIMDECFSEKECLIESPPPKCQEIALYKEPALLDSIYSQFFLILQADFPDLFKQIENNILSKDNHFLDPVRLQDFYSKNKEAFFDYLNYHLKEAYAFLVYCYDIIASVDETEGEKRLKEDFLKILNEIVDSLENSKDINELYLLARRESEIMKTELLLMSSRKKTRMRLESSIAAVLAQVMQVMDTLKQRLPDITKLQLYLSDDTGNDNLMDVAQSQLQITPCFPTTLSETYKDQVFQIRTAIYQEHAKFTSLFNYDPTVDKHFFNDPENGESIYLEGFKMRVKGHESIRRKLFHDIFNPKNTACDPFRATDYIGLLIEIEGQFREKLINFLFEKDVFSSEKSTMIAKVSNSVRLQISTLLKGGKINESIFTKEQQDVWKKLTDIFQYEDQQNACSIDGYSVTSFKNKIPVFQDLHQEQEDWLGEEILILTPEESQFYKASHNFFRKKQVTTFLEHFIGLKDVFMKRGVEL